MSNKTALKRIKIKKRIRKVVFGTSTKPRLSVYRSNKEIYAQLIDDTNSKTIVAASSKDKDLKIKTTNKIEVSNHYFPVSFTSQVIYPLWTNMPDLGTELSFGLVFPLN